MLQPPRASRWPHSAFPSKTCTHPILALVPHSPGQVLDVGCGIGRDAAALAAMGHRVLAVEPMAEFLQFAASRHPESTIEWRNDSLPLLETITSASGSFDFVLASAVWHHLDDSQRAIAMARIATLTRPGGIFALSLRNGPAGQGHHVSPTNAEATRQLAEHNGFTTRTIRTNLPSLIPGKPLVKWSKLAFQRD
ncbi:MAG: class I SAM-dependent methyltransferase [Pseudomonadales bacterium]